MGNVLATITDQKIAVPSQSNSSLIDHYEAVVVSTQDYYPFGMIQEGRSAGSASYRYGFNGKENDNDVKDIEGSQQDYGMRIYDPRVGRFLSLDPITKEYPKLTPYQFASNTPIAAVDWDGAEAKISIGGTGNGANYNQSQKYAFEAWAMNQTKNGFQYAGIVASGAQMLNKFKEITKKDGSILSVITFTHSGPEGIFLNSEEGFYRGNALRRSTEGRNVTDLVNSIKSGEIKFESNASWVLGSCFCGSDYVGPGLAESITKETGVTTLGATGHVVPEINNGKETGRFKTVEPGSTFYKFNKVFEATFEIKGADQIQWVGNPISVTNNTVTFKFDSQATLDSYMKSFNYDNKYKYKVEEKIEKTDVGNVIDPSKL